MDGCTLIISTLREARVAAVQASPLSLATRRHANPLISDISKGNAPHSGGATPCTDLQGWPFALLSEKNGENSFSDFPAGVYPPRPAGLFSKHVAACFEKSADTLHLLHSSFGGFPLRLGRAFLRAHPCGAFREGRFPYPSFASSYWVSRPSGRAFTRLRSMLIRILNAKPFAVTGLRNPRVSMLGRRTPVNS